VTSFPHVGGVEIEDDVEIGANTCIDRGSLGNTIVRRGAKIDNLVHIAHNVVVGRNAFVIANAMIGGSTILGDGSWTSPSATLRDGIRIGDGATVGLGAVVTKSIPDGAVWMGTPARPISEFVAMQKKLKDL
jgi:UDP-3-O-[3-hydroxymyristoyl] glucosamine N-acyltransferase